MNQRGEEKRKSARVLVTGGGGFLGGAIVKKLVQRGDRVSSLSRGFYPQLESLGVEQIRADLVDPTALEQACQGVEAVYHVAAKAGVWGKYEDFYNANVTGTHNVIAACKSARVPVLVYTSSPSVIFDGTDMEGIDESVPYPQHYHAHYPKTKAEAERAVIRAADDSLRVVALRPHIIWGPGDPHMAPRIIARAKRLRRIGRGDNRVDTIYVDNAADAHILAADALAASPELSGRIYFISQDDPIPLWDMVDAILAAAGLGPVKGSVPPWAAWYIGLLLEQAYRVLNLKGEPQMTRFVANELATAHWFDISAAKRDLGYRPAVSIAEGLIRLEHWLKENR